MTYKRIADGDEAQGDLMDFIKADMDRWASVAYRELSLEKVRRDEYPNYPSRLACLYTSRALEDARKWSQFFKNIGRDVYSIVKLKVYGNIFDGDACNCFDGTEVEEDNLEKARHYWRNDVKNENPVIETLVDGEIIVDEIVEDFHTAVSSYAKQSV